MGFQKVSVNQTSLKPKPDVVEVSREAGDRIEWSFEGRGGDLFIVSLDKGGCFKSSNGIYQVTVRTGSTTARIRTGGLKTTTSKSYKYSITRIRNGRAKSVDPRINIRD